MRTCTRRLFPAFLSSDNLPSTSVILKGKKKKIQTTLSLRNWLVASEWSVNSFVSTQLFSNTQAVFSDLKLFLLCQQEFDSEIQACTNNPFYTTVSSNNFPSLSDYRTIYLFIYLAREEPKQMSFPLCCYLGSVLSCIPKACGQHVYYVKGPEDRKAIMQHIQLTG